MFNENFRCRRPFFGRNEVKITYGSLERLLVEEDSQGLVEYILIVVLVALVFWLAIKNTNIGSKLASDWSKVTVCVSDASFCTSSS